MSSADFDEYWTALNNAFDVNSLQQMLRSKIGAQVEKKLVWNAPLKDITFRLIQLAEAEGWHLKLLQAAHDHSPHNQLLRDLCDKHGLSLSVEVQVDGKPTPESPSGDTALDIWKEKLAFLQNQEAITADAGQKFNIQELIKEAQQKIREFE